jgi:hypothetical protein
MKMTKAKKIIRKGKMYAKSQNQRRVDVLVVFALIVSIVVADHPPSHRHIHRTQDKRDRARDSCYI